MTARILSLTVALTLLANSGLPPTPAEDLKSEIQQDIVVFATKPIDLTTAGWALGRFEQVGLDLPAVEIRFHNDKERCGGSGENYGVWRTRSESSDIIEMCTNRGFHVLHELAHAWADATLTVDDRAAFAELRGLAGWTGTDMPWETKAVEHAANIIAWGLYGEPQIRVAKTMRADTLSSLTQAFEFLTGFTPPSQRDKLDSNVDFASFG